MVTRMPGFGVKNLQGLRAKLVAIDERKIGNAVPSAEYRSAEGKEVGSRGSQTCRKRGIVLHQMPPVWQQGHARDSGNRHVDHD